MDDSKPEARSTSSLLAVEDTAFLLRDEMRRDLALFEYAETAEQGWDSLVRRGLGVNGTRAPAPGLG